jgi:hypothetical protein
MEYISNISKYDLWVFMLFSIILCLCLQPFRKQANLLSSKSFIISPTFNYFLKRTRPSPPHGTSRALFWKKCTKQGIAHIHFHVKDCCILYIECSRGRWVIFMFRIRRSQVQTSPRRLSILIEVLPGKCSVSTTGRFLSHPSQCRSFANTKEVGQILS